MPDNGVRTIDLTNLASAEDLLAHDGGTLGVLPVPALSTRLAASGALAEAIAGRASTEQADALAAEIDVMRTEYQEIGADLATLEAEDLPTRVQTLEEGQAGGFVAAATWTGLQAITPSVDGTAGEVLDSDTGTHSAASGTGYDGATVDNAGRYSWNTSWGRWVRIGDTGLSAKADSADLAPVAFSGGYADLTDRPALGTAAAEDSTAFASAAQGALAQSAVQPAAILGIGADLVYLEGRGVADPVTLSADG
ncbi:MAG TPA: hypothetical protein DEB47_22295, partial [Citreicella sp.]|nr:hypothetical protein [Citreicella sp.]